MARRGYAALGLYNPKNSINVGHDIFGPEDGTLGRAVTDWCRDTVYIPAGCLNLAACVNVVLYDRMLKRGEHHGGGSRPGRRSFMFTDAASPSRGAEKG